MSQPTFDFGDDPLDDAANPTYGVAELADAINATLRRGFSDGVWVRGEIDGLRSSGPHTYFALVEHGDAGKAVLNVSLFAPAKRRLTPKLRKSRLDLADGMAVRVFGALDYYAPNGRLGLKMADIDPRFTLGELSQARDRVMQRLIAAGLLDANRRRRLSPAPLRVGVVSSVGTAAWHDFHNELERSAFGFELAVCDTRVQGEFAAASVAAAIGTLGRRDDLDCVVVIRGGGARNELATFDDEAIAVAIATSPLPVLTGLGHEVDRSIADEVAHTALKTPTACAGALVGAVAEYRAAIDHRWGRIAARAERLTDRAGGALATRAHTVARRSLGAADRAGHGLSARHQRAIAGARRRLVEADRTAAAQSARLVRRAPQVVARHTVELDGRAARIALADPERLLARGWSITRTGDGALVRSSDDVAVGITLVTQLAHGTLTSRIEET